MNFTWSARANKYVGIAVGVIFVVLTSLGMWWSVDPDPIAPEAKVQANGKPIIGYSTTSALINTVEVLLNKPGGWTSNDTLPPGVFLDNMHSFEFGALEQVRDLARAMRKDFSRSQSQSLEDKDLSEAQAKFNIDHTSWLIPRAENEYQEAVKLLEFYRLRISDPSNVNAQFYARADNLNEWLKEVQKRLGGLSQRLSASVETERVNTDLAGDSAAKQSTEVAPVRRFKTPWLDIDNVFYEARGSSWALLNFMRAIEVDFADVLEKKNARTSVQQIIRELEATQQTVYSPMILNGSGFGILANHSLVMANYISRANAAVIDLNNLLSQG
ncbi:DUF2333 family protein [Shewanella sp. 202IG2-18]|uniref:DUF2333 family protein n=1 Tax=Parashewanella hymeniacidonis TaxID=2807618 RepID=UPI00195FF2E1|nr:DUF2333 family protein [Parashewanella hymeniacidonis]MBM7070689.1 DUF2333 family protein [Parashewanella hymeniacidonis]